MSSLYEIDSEIGVILNELEGTGEIPPELAIRLDALEESRDAKIHSCLCVIRNRESRAAAIQAEIDRLEAAKKAEQRRCAWLMSYIKESMRATAQKKIVTPLFTVSLVMNSQPTVGCNGEIPSDYAKTKTEISLDRTKILADWKAGITLPSNIQIARETHLRIT